MKITIVTVSFNSKNSIGKTIESVMMQDYAELEYLIIDGGSKDGTAAVAESYAGMMREKNAEYRVISEPDGGIYDGMNKGARLATGEIIGFLNCGDTYEPGTLETVAKAFQSTDCDMTVGNLRIFRRNGSTFIKRSRLRKYQTSRDWNHPTAFVKTRLLREYPFRMQGIHDDYGFYLQMVRQGRKIYVIDQVLANFHMGGISNQKSLKLAKKRILDRYRYCYRANGYGRGYLLECIAMEIAKFIVG